MHVVAGLPERRFEGHRWNDGDTLRTALPRQDKLLLSVNAGVAACRLASAAHVSRNVKLRPLVLGMAAHACQPLPIVNLGCVDLGVTDRAAIALHPRET